MSQRYLALLLLVSRGPLVAQTRVPSPEDQIAAAVLPLPATLRSGATVRGYDANLAPVVLRQGSNNMVCSGDRPGDNLFDVRCYERAFQAVIDRRREIGPNPTPDGGEARLVAEIKTGKVKLPDYVTAGYRMEGPITAYDPRTRTWTAAIERWESIHFPFQTAADIGLPEESYREGMRPYVMSSGTWWSHVMIRHGPRQVEASSRERLGSLTFPNSGATAAQGDFVRGVLYLHSFEYDDAAKAFQAAQRADPGFVMAYWGEAMTYTHPVWNEQDVARGRAALARIAPSAADRAAKAGTPRERAWLAAVEALYGEGSKIARDTLYERAMAKVAAEFPDDEATLFHALAILGLNQGERDVPAYMRAGAMALDVFERQPDHPGAAHYVIHAFDDPDHAAIGLKAARAYSRIAPGAAHAQHMTTHIFLALGMWPEVIAQNVIASGPDRSQWFAHHYTYWLHYGLLQAGRIDEAAALLDELRTRAGATPRPPQSYHLMAMVAQQVVTGERWNDPAIELLSGAERLMRPGAKALPLFARGYAAVQRGDRGATTTALEQLERLANDTAAGEAPRLLASELTAAQLRADGKKAEAEALLTNVAKSAAVLPVEYGPPDFVKPPWELLGEWYLADGRTAEAHQAFTRSLAVMPGRLLSLRGLSHSR